LAEPDLADWLSTCRLSPFANAGPYLGDPATTEAFGRMVGAQAPAVENLQRLLAEVDSFETA
jgi:hypothetical protein